MRNLCLDFLLFQEEEETNLALTLDSGGIWGIVELAENVRRSLFFFFF